MLLGITELTACPACGETWGKHPAPVWGPKHSVVAWQCPACATTWPTDAQVDDGPACEQLSLLEGNTA